MKCLGNSMHRVLLLFALALLISCSGYSQWPRGQGVFTAISSGAIPAFPRILSEYRYTGRNLDFWEHSFRSSGSVRVFEGSGWESLYDGARFPNTMNQCDAGVFMIRWSTGNPNVKVWSAVGFDETNMPRIAHDRRRR
jgi:hypothetical protein